MFLDEYTYWTACGLLFILIKKNFIWNVTKWTVVGQAVNVPAFYFSAHQWSHIRPNSRLGNAQWQARAIPRGSRRNRFGRNRKCNDWCAGCYARCVCAWIVVMEICAKSDVCVCVDTRYDCVGLRLRFKEILKASTVVILCVVDWLLKV